MGGWLWSQFFARRSQLLTNDCEELSAELLLRVHSLRVDHRLTHLTHRRPIVHSFQAYAVLCVVPSPVRVSCKL